MKINKKEEYLKAKIDKWDLQLSKWGENTIKIFLYKEEYFGNRFIGFYDTKTKAIRPLYYNVHIDYREKMPTERQQEKIKYYCLKLLNTLLKEV